MNHHDAMHKLRDIAYYMEKLKELGVCWRTYNRPLYGRYHTTIEQISIKEVYNTSPSAMGDCILIFYRLSIDPKNLRSLYVRVGDDPHLTFHATKEEAEEAVVLGKIKSGGSGV